MPFGSVGSKLFKTRVGKYIYKVDSRRLAESKSGNDGLCNSKLRECLLVVWVVNYLRPGWVDIYNIR